MENNGIILPKIMFKAKMHGCKSTMVKTECTKQEMFRNTQPKSYHQYKILRCFPVYKKKKKTATPYTKFF